MGEEEEQDFLFFGGPSAVKMLSELVATEATVVPAPINTLTEPCKTVDGAFSTAIVAVTAASHSCGLVNIIPFGEAR